MPRQNGFPKVRTGCRTCKARKVKCDEARPFCMRCKSAKRECRGYEQFQSGEHRSLTWYRPQQLATGDQKEGRAFQFFTVNVGPVLSGTRSSDFWTHLVMQFSHFSPAIRHAVLSISSLYEDFQNGRQVSSRLPSSPFPIKHYAASIAQIKTAQDENITLLACVLFLCIEYLLENVDSAVQHCRHGIAILNNGSCSDWVRQHIAPILRRISLLPFFSEVPHINSLAPSNRHIAVDDEVLPFDSVEQAEEYFEQIETHARVLRPWGGCESPSQREATRSDCIQLIEAWESRATLLECSQSAVSVQSRVALCRILAMKEVLRLRVLCCLEQSETRFDEYLDSFKAILRLAEESVELRAGMPTLSVQPVFTFEEGFLPPLMFVANDCRHFPTRTRALELMSEVPAPKEGPIDVGTLYRASQRVIEIEHGVSLDDYDPTTDSNFPYPPAAKRVICIPVKDYFGQVADVKDTAVSTRPFKIISRASDGAHSMRVEYIADSPPKHRPNLPSMLCAKPRDSGKICITTDLSRPLITPKDVPEGQSGPHSASSVSPALTSNANLLSKARDSFTIPGRKPSSREQSCRNYWKF